MANDYSRIWAAQVILLLVAAVAVPGRSAAADPATEPATQPAGVNVPVAHDRVQQITRWFDELNSADAPTRESARISLMGLNRGELEALRRLVVERRPLAPAQAMVLREVVAQAFLASMTYEPDGSDGFLGIQPIAISIGARPQQEAADPAPGPQAAPMIFVNGGQVSIADPNFEYGILVAARVPGFCAARWLRDGDIIVGITERPAMHVRNPEEFRLTICNIGAGHVAHVVLLRQGTVIQVPILLDSRPKDAAIDIHKLEADRENALDEFWGREFSPLLNDGPS